MPVDHRSIQPEPPYIHPYGGLWSAGDPLLAYAARTGTRRNLDALRASHDGVLLALWAGKRVQRKQFESSYPEAAILCAPKK